MKTLKIIIVFITVLFAQHSANALSDKSERTYWYKHTNNKNKWCLRYVQKAN